MSDFCEIIVKGHLDIDWSGWFEGLTITHSDDGETMLTGQIRDQTALYGIITKVRDMGLSLIMVKYMAGDSAKEGSEQGSALEDDSWVQ